VPESGLPWFFASVDCHLNGSFYPLPELIAEEWRRESNTSLGIESQAASCFDEGDALEVYPVVERAFRHGEAAGKFVDVDRNLVRHIGVSRVKAVFVDAGATLAYSRRTIKGS
jgi:hypothetical protein